MKPGILFVDKNIEQAAEEFAAISYARDRFADEREYNAYKDGFIAGAAYLFLVNQDIKDIIKTTRIKKK